MANFENWQALSKSELRAIYTDKPMAAIAAMYGITTSAVAHRLRMWGIKSPHPPGPKPSFNPEPKELARLYKKMSMRDMAIHYGVGETVVFNRIKTAGLPLITRSERLAGKPKSKAHKAKMSEAQKGKTGNKNPNWRGGVSSTAAIGRSNHLHKEWKAAVLVNAGYRCQRCKSEQGSRCGCCGHILRLHVHHIKEYAKYPDLRYELSNGEALCEKCHYAEHYAQIG